METGHKSVCGENTFLSVGSVERSGTKLIESGLDSKTG